MRHAGGEVPLQVADPGLKRHMAPLLNAGTDVLGRALVYPNGPPHMTVHMVELEPGEESGWHEHPVPLFCQILAGEFTVDYGSKGVQRFRVGDTLMEAQNWPHNARNLGLSVARVLAVYIGSSEYPTLVRVPGPL
jgi:quercetin dioxygenase-like cupin family protein